MTVLVGVDWGDGSHAVCVINSGGEVLDRFAVNHDRQGLGDLVRRLRKRQGEIRIAIERPSGLLVDTLVEAGFTVVPIHPNVVKACRPRYRAVSAKSDPGDAYILADILRTTAIACARSSRSPMPSRPCAASCAAAMIWWPRALPWPISSPPCCKASGPLPQRSSMT